MTLKDLDKKIRAYALKNALAHDGKAQAGAIISALFGEGLKQEDAKTTMPKINITINEVNSLNLEQQEKEFEKLKDLVHEREARVGLPELPGAKKGKVIMRFAPSPSGALHIGHAATGSISALYVKKYGGTFYVRIEDTNPDNIYAPAYKMIEQEAKWLWGKETKIVIQSDRMALYYDYVEKLFKKNSAYVCTCSQEEFKSYVEAKKNCPCRGKSLKENQNDWKKMLSNKEKENFKEGGAVIRFKTSMQEKNPAFRDFPLARINDTLHPRQGHKYRVWPLMNLAVTVDDIELKITHVIRAVEHKDNARKQERIFKVLGKKYPWDAYVGLYDFPDLELSATKITKGIESGEYSGWDDLKLPTLAALKKRGYKPEAFYGIAIRSGLTESNKKMTRAQYFELLDYFNGHTEEIKL